MNYTEMILRTTGEKVQVYNLYVDQTAIIWSDEQARRRTHGEGNGWMRIKISKLIPLNKVGTFNPSITTLMNKAKRRLGLRDDIWVTSDGVCFHNDYKEEAIRYELKLMEREEEIGLGNF